MDATGRLAFTDHTACRIWLRKPSTPERSLRTTNVTDRMALAVGPGPKTPSPIGGQYTISGAFSWTPFSKTSWTIPITSLQGDPGNSRTCLPIAADGEPHNSRARFSERSTTGRRPWTSVQVRSRPAIMRVPAAWKNPGETYWYIRRGGISLSG